MLDLLASAFRRVDAAHFCNLGLKPSLAALCAKSDDMRAGSLHEDLVKVCGNTRLMPQRINIGPDRVVDKAHGELCLKFLSEMANGAAPISPSFFRAYKALVVSRMKIYAAGQLKNGNEAVAEAAGIYIETLEESEAPKELRTQGTASRWVKTRSTHSDEIWATLLGNAEGDFLGYGFNRDDSTSIATFVTRGGLRRAVSADLFRASTPVLSRPVAPAFREGGAAVLGARASQCASVAHLDAAMLMHLRGDTHRDPEKRDIRHPRSGAPGRAFGPGRRRCGSGPRGRRCRDRTGCPSPPPARRTDTRWSTRRPGAGEREGRGTGLHMRRRSPRPRLSAEVRTVSSPHTGGASRAEAPEGEVMGLAAFAQRLLLVAGGVPVLPGRAPVPGRLRAVHSNPWRGTCSSVWRT